MVRLGLGLLLLIQDAIFALLLITNSSATGNAVTEGPVGRASHRVVYYKGCLVDNVERNVLAEIESNLQRMLNEKRTEIEKPDEEETLQPLVARPPEKSLSPLDRTYLDVWEIVSEENSCSRFFGGSEKVTMVLDDFVNRVRVEPLDAATVGIRMSGHYSEVIDHPTRFTYRLFDNTTLNSRGPFFKAYHPYANTPYWVGPYSAGSREARILMLLHEMGHLIKKGDGQWLLPDDGASTGLNFRNTQAVEQQCGTIIRGLARREKV